MKKTLKISFLILLTTLFIYSCQETEEQILESEELTEQDILAIQKQLEENLSQLNITKASQVAASYSSFQEFMEQASIEEKALFRGTNTIYQKLENRLKTTIKSKGVKFVSSQFTSTSKTNTNALKDTNCYDICLMESHEVWFDTYASTGDMQTANTAQSFYYAGCSYGCTASNGDPDDLIY
ncbi:hypothetical protein [Fulvivirga ligni]|uniref:hypothetical protein n=1 Tax=Fulvivirga ligni TaxID=2904246 RepID=UPI001F19FE7E|nr:hypothetical protein [Fulvivirga ligni]UII20601.1 hypothetical protein LVD16_22425 [Fulvivirga ligni]